MKIFNKQDAVVGFFKRTLSPDTLKKAYKLFLKGFALGIFTAVTREIYWVGVSGSIALFIMLMLGIIYYNYSTKGKALRNVIEDACMFTVIYLVLLFFA